MSDQPQTPVQETVEQTVPAVKRILKSRKTKLALATLTGVAVGALGLRAYQKNAAGEEISFTLPDAVESSDS